MNEITHIFKYFEIILDAEEVVKSSTEVSIYPPLTTQIFPTVASYIIIVQCVNRVFIHLKTFLFIVNYLLVYSGHLLIGLLISN